MDPARYDVSLTPPPLDWPAPRRKFQDRRWVHALLFVLTVATTTYAGSGHYLHVEQPDKVITTLNTWRVACTRKALLTT